MGAGIAAGGWGLVNLGHHRPHRAQLADFASRCSPLTGGAIATAFLCIIKRSTTHRSVMTEACARMVLWLMAVMAWVFGTHVVLKSVGPLLHASFAMAVIGTSVIAVAALALVRQLVACLAQTHDNSKQGVNRLFT